MLEPDFCPLWNIFSFFKKKKNKKVFDLIDTVEEKNSLDYLSLKTS